MANPQRIELLKKFIDEEPENAFNKYALAMEYYETEPNKALDLLNDLLTNSEEYLPTYYKAAHLYWDMEQLENAANIFIKGIALAKKLKDEKALGELSSAFQNLQFEMD